jgi:hypothetical protein
VIGTVAHDVLDLANESAWAQQRGLANHNHTTGQLRGLLRGNRNRGIGYLQDDPELIRGALEYMLSY